MKITGYTKEPQWSDSWTMGAVSHPRKSCGPCPFHQSSRDALLSYLCLWIHHVGLRESVYFCRLGASEKQTKKDLRQMRERILTFLTTQTHIDELQKQLHLGLIERLSNCLWYRPSIIQRILEPVSQSGHSRNFSSVTNQSLLSPNALDYLLKHNCFRFVLCFDTSIHAP